MRKYFVYLLLMHVFCSCHENNSSKSSDPSVSISTKSTIAQGEVANACLNIASYGLAFHTLNPNMQINRVSKNIAISPTTLSPNFILSRTFAAFQFDALTASEFIDFDGYTQSDCKTLIYTSADGTDEEYQITDASLNSITASTLNGSSLQYTWLSSTSVLVKKRYPILDLPCSSDKGFVEVTLIYDWSAPFPALISADSPLAIDPGLISILATASGTNLISLYQDQNTKESLITSSLENLALTPIRPDYLACTASTIASP